MFNMGSVCHMNIAEAKQNTTESYLRSRLVVQKNKTLVNLNKHKFRMLMAYILSLLTYTAHELLNKSKHKYNHSSSPNCALNIFLLLSHRITSLEGITQTKLQQTYTQYFRKPHT